MSSQGKDKTHRRTVSAGDASSPPELGSPVEDRSLSESLCHNGKIAQTCSPKFTRHFIHGLSATWSGKPPKVPQPEQAELTFSVVRNGLREITRLAKQDLMSLKYAVDSSSISSLQIKTAERYWKKLEFHLSRLEELQEKYEVQRKMRDGIRSMTNAYILSHGKERETALHNVHTGYKECNELLCSYESKLQLMMGTFLFEMIGIQGFARMCSGDIFEIVIKHGDQKWKSRGHVLKNNKQSWENRRVLFRALFKEPLYIKAVEVRGLGKNILLGNKYCETRDLFSAHPQQMTINLNPSGSLKLSLVITWNPVHGVSDGNALTSRPSFGSQSVLNKEEAASSFKGLRGSKDGTILPDKEPVQFIFDSCGELNTVTTGERTRHRSAVYDSGAVAEASVDEKCALHRGGDSSYSSPPPESDSYSHSLCKTTSYKPNADTSSQVWSSGQSVNSSECNSVEMASSSEYSCSNSSRLQDVLCSLVSSLENVLGQYPELEDLYEKVSEIERVLKFQRQRSLGSDVSISIKSALGCFDFLNSAVDGGDIDTVSDSIMDGRTLSDKGATDDLDNQDLLTSSLGPSPEPLSSGLEQLDVALVAHADYSLKLLDKLCSTSPLKCLEVLSLDKLKRQTSCFASFLKVIRMKDDDRTFSCSELFMENEYDLKMLWLKLVQADMVYSVVDQILPALEKFVLQSVSSEVDSNLALKVAGRMLCQMLDKTSFTPESIVTVYHFKSYFEGSNLIHTVIQNVLKEVNVLDDLYSRQATRIKSALAGLNQVMPFTEALLELGSFLIDSDAYLKRLAECYLREISSEGSMKTKILTSYLEGLESEDKRVRQGSCAALRVMNACDCCEQLVYISYADESPQVRHEAKIALFALGDTGRKLYENYERFTSSTRN